MKPIYFKEVNTQFAKDQPEYNTLPAFNKKNQVGEVVTCWNLSLKERLTLLFTGRVWMSLWSFNQPLSPSRLTTNKKDLIN